MIELVIEQRSRDLGSFEVGRVLPFAKRRMVGPYIFFDRMGPKDLAPGLPREADVRPHPHIGLSTITYLFAGEITHRDSVGSEQPIHPGEVNWMTAGRGITHSERFERLRLSIRLRNPYVDPISLLQVDLLRRWRAGNREDDALLDALVSTVNGIAAGIQNTG